MCGPLGSHRHQWGLDRLKSRDPKALVYDHGAHSLYTVSYQEFKKSEFGARVLIISELI